MNFIKIWLKNRKDKYEKQRWINGYNFAVGCLLRNEVTPLELESMQWRDTYDSFDKGMDAGIDKVVNLGIVEDNRI